MTNEKLLEYIFEGSNNRFALLFKHWIESSDRFMNFAGDKRDKIRNKIQGTRDDENDLDDVRSEIEIAYLLLQHSLFSNVEYEKYGKKEPNPDFTITCTTGTVFNMEVRRIRKAQEEENLEEWKSFVIKRIIAFPSKLEFGLDVPAIEPDINLAKRLNGSRKDIVDYIKRKIREEV